MKRIKLTLTMVVVVTTMVLAAPAMAQDFSGGVIEIDNPSGSATLVGSGDFDNCSHGYDFRGVITIDHIFFD